MDPAGSHICEQRHHDLDGSSPRSLWNPGPKYQSPESESNGGQQSEEADLGEEDTARVKKVSKDQYGWRRVIRNFTPS